MNLEEARNNIGAEVELDESTKPYTFLYDDGKEYERISDTDDSKTYKIIDFDDAGNAILEIKGYQINPRHLKLKPQNYKIHVPTETESREAQELFFELGYGRLNSCTNYNDMPYIYSYSCGDVMEIKVGWTKEYFDSHENKKITLQELREMVARKKGEDKTVRVTGTFQNFEARKEMTWRDAFRAVADGKEVDYYNNHYGEWENVKDLSIREVMEGKLKFRLAPKRIKLEGEYTKEELLQKIEEME